MSTVTPALNKANREVCDVDIRILKNKAPFLYFDTANTTTVGLTGDSVYAMAKGQRRIAYHNPMEGTMTLEAQVYPFKLFALLTDGVINADGVYPVKKTLTAAAAQGSGSPTITITPGTGRTVTTGTVFVYPVGSFGDESAAIEGSFTNNVFSSANLTAGTEYEVGYIVSTSSGVKRISFANSKVPKDYYITMKTLDKDDEGVLTPFLITAYKATVQRTWELSFTSEGDPASVTVTFDLLEDKDGNILDMIELTDEAE